MRGSQRLDVVLGGTLLVTGLLEVAADRVGFRPIPAVIAVLVGSAAICCGRRDRCCAWLCS
jgi:hypothetical protein